MAVLKGSVVAWLGALWAVLGAGDMALVGGIVDRIGRR